VAMRNARRGFPVKMSLSQLLRNEVGDEAYENAIGPKANSKGKPRIRRICVPEDLRRRRAKR
jgi:hypothetical protein